jgi:glycosyltransferase involved in cell wall biosynthesis
MTEHKRKKIGILFNFRKGWMGGIIYIINLVNTLNFLDESEQPDIVLLYNPDLKEFLPQMKYPRLTLVEWNFPGVYGGFVKTWLTRKNVFVDEAIRHFRLDGVYPSNDRPIHDNYPGVKVVGWIPDLQHKFYPHFFGAKRTFLREQRIRLFLKNATDLAVSSHDVENHFRRFYQIKPSLRIHKLRFVSIIDNFEFPSLETLRERYKIPAGYFIVSNQFTNHKNHFAVLEALKILKASGSEAHVVFTGKMEFKGNEAYIKRIREMVTEFGITDRVSFLGVIPRQDQLGLMKHSIAVVQPSLFEGWSTVIEDAKSLQVPVIASNLDVNIEQVGDTASFFDPHNYGELADLLRESHLRHPVCNYPPYEGRVKDFARDFIKIFQ